MRLYIACCPVCEKFIRLNQTPRAGLRSIKVGGRGDCLAMDIVGGMDSLPLTPRSNRYQQRSDCFTRFAVAVLLVDQSSEVVIASILGHYITVYNTPCRILTDQTSNQSRLLIFVLYLEFLKYENLLIIHSPTGSVISLTKLLNIH